MVFLFIRSILYPRFDTLQDEDGDEPHSLAVSSECCCYDQWLCFNLTASSRMTPKSSTLLVSPSTQLVHPLPMKTCGCLDLKRTPPRTIYSSSWRTSGFCCASPSNNLPLLNSNNSPSAPHSLPPSPLPPVVSLRPAWPTIPFYGPTLRLPPTPPFYLLAPRLGDPPVLPVILHPRAYAAYKAGGLANSKGGSMRPRSKLHSCFFP